MTRLDSFVYKSKTEETAVDMFFQCHFYGYINKLPGYINNINYLDDKLSSILISSTL